MKTILVTTLFAATLSLGLAGCESTQTAKIPASATPVASASGTTSYRTADTGTLYIYDKTWNRMVYSGAVKPDQNVEVNTGKNAVMIDNRAVAEQLNLGGGDKFQFYLDPTTASTTTIERKTVTERETHE